MSQGTIYQRCDSCSIKMVRGKCPRCQQRKGRWMAMASLGRDGQGKRIRKAIYGHTQEAVQRELNKLLVNAESGIEVAPDRLTVAEYAKRWLDHVRPTVEMRTFVEYESKIRVHIVPGLGTQQLSRVKPLHIQGLYDARLSAGKSPRTVVHIHEVLHNMLNQAVQWQLIATNPVEHVKPPQTQKQQSQFLTFGQAREWLHVLEGNKLESLHLTAIITGMRQGELLGLRWQDIDFDTGVLTVQQTVWIYKREPIFKPYPKNKKVRRLPIPPMVVAKLKVHRIRQLEEKISNRQAYQDYNLVWARPDGLPIRHEYVLDQLRKTLSQAGLPNLRFHDLRHSAASLLIALGTPLKEVSETLGHSSIDITADLYGHLLPDAQRETALQFEAALMGQNTRRRSSK